MGDRVKKECGNCVHQKMCRYDRNLVGHPVMLNPIFGTYEERCRIYLEQEEALKRDCEDWMGKKSSNAGASPMGRM